MLRRAAAQRLRSPAVAPSSVQTSTASIARIVAANSTSTTRSSPLIQASSLSTRAALHGRFQPPNKNSPPPSQKPAQQQQQQQQQQAPPTSATSTSPSQPTQKPSKPEAKPEEKPAEKEEEVTIPFSELPDLTQGIPSTLDQELRGATKEAAALAAIRDELAAQAEAGGAGAEAGAGAGAGAGGGEGDGAGKGGRREKGELPASAYVSSSEKRRQKIANYMFAGAFALGVFGTAYAGRNWDDEEEAKRHPKIPNGWGLGLWWERVSARTGELLNYYHEPAFEKLLPDPDPVYSRPYTLCISLEDMLIHSEWTREHGWRVAKRPGADYFIHYLSQYYEIVLFTTQPFAMAEPMVRKMDPFRFMSYALFREATKYQDGEIVKDLSYLNRDLSKVIILDTKASHVKAQPENAIVLPKWTGNPKNQDLVALIPFLEYIHTMQYGDVRKIIKSFEGKEIPKEFARREAIARAEFKKQLEAQRGKRRAPSGGGLGSLLGFKSSTMSSMVSTSPDGQTVSLAEQMAQGKMLQDIAREQGQKNYEMMEKEIRENGEKWLKEEAAMQEKMQQEAMQNMKQSFAGWFLSSGEPEQPKPAESGKQ